MGVKKVLIVDDAAFMRRKLRQILEPCGIEVVGEAADGQEAVRLTSELQPDIVTLDITMPNLDGISCLRDIKAARENVIVLMISALGQKEKVMECLRQGAVDFIVKPFDAERVKSVIARFTNI
jgi:two-component system chemotaxis response regulator CheY